MKTTFTGLAAMIALTLAMSLGAPVYAGTAQQGRALSSPASVAQSTATTQLAHVSHTWRCKKKKKRWRCHKKRHAKRLWRCVKRHHTKKSVRRCIRRHSWRWWF